MTRCFGTHVGAKPTLTLLQLISFSDGDVGETELAEDCVRDDCRLSARRKRRGGGAPRAAPARTPPDPLLLGGGRGKGLPLPQSLPRLEVAMFLCLLAPRRPPFAGLGAGPSPVAVQRRRGRPPQAGSAAGGLRGRRGEHRRLGGGDASEKPESRSGPLLLDDPGGGGGPRGRVEGGAPGGRGREGDHRVALANEGGGKGGGGVALGGAGRGPGNRIWAKQSEEAGHDERRL